MAGFFLTVSPPTILALAEQFNVDNKTVCMILSAPFIPQFVAEPLNKVGS